MSLSHEEDEETGAPQQAMAQVREAITTDIAWSQDDAEAVVVTARSVNLGATPVERPGEALKRAVAAQLKVVEEVGDKVRAATTSVEAQQWQTVQRNAFQDLRAAEEAAQEYEARQAASLHNRAMERFGTFGGMSLGVVVVVAGTALSLLGHPVIGAPIVGGGAAFIKQALAKPKDGRKEAKK